MLPIREIEDIFLRVLQENNNRDAINKRVKYFDSHDFERLYELSIKHRLLPVFYNRILSLDLENIPPEFTSRLKNIYIVNLRRNLLLERELLRILSIFKDSDIPVMPLKGVVFARYLYGDLAFRQSSIDLDLLVREEQIAKAESLLKELGYSFLGKEEDDDRNRFLKLKYDRHLQFSVKANALNTLNLELHCDTRGFFVVTNLRDFWHNSREEQIDGYKVLMPSPEDMLIYLSQLSLSTFEFVELKYLYDLHMCIDKFKRAFHWDSILKKQNIGNLKSYIFFALRLCRNLFQTDIPQGLINQFKPALTKIVFLQAWVNKKNILRKNNFISSSYSWRYLASTCLYAQDLFDFLRKIYEKVFLPMEEVVYFYRRQWQKWPYAVYIKRLLKPFFSPAGLRS